MNSSESITRHLSEYFAETREHLPGCAHRHCGSCRAGVGWRICSRRPPRGNAENLARKFIAGSNLEEAVLAVERLRRKKLTFTVDLLGEATITEKEAAQNQAEYLELIEGLSANVNTWRRST